MAVCKAEIVEITLRLFLSLYIKSSVSHQGVESELMKDLHWIAPSKGVGYVYFR